MAADAKLERQLTQGDFEVLGIDGVDEATGTVFLLLPTRATRGSGTSFLGQAGWNWFAAAHAR